MKNKKLWLFTLLVILLALATMLWLPANRIESYGSILAAAGGFIAVIWFYNGLQLQRIQLEEQGKQFQLEFDNIKLESKRSAMLVARDILTDMEHRVVAKLGGEIEILPTLFINILQHLKPITESDDPEIVLNAVKIISTVLGPARMFLYAMREAGMCILENEGFTFKNPDAIQGAPEHYIIANYDKLMFRPFISRHINTAQMLANLMVRLDLEIITHALLAALELQNQKNGLGSLITDEAKTKIKDYNNKKKKGIPIIDKYLSTLAQDF